MSAARRNGTLAEWAGWVDDAGRRDCHERHGQVACCRCNAPVEGRSDRRFCSDACRQAEYRDRKREARRWRALSEALTGLAILMRRPGGEAVTATRNANSDEFRNASTG